MKAVLLSLAAEFPRQWRSRGYSGVPCSGSQEEGGDPNPGTAYPDPGRGTRPGAFQEAP